MFSDFCYVDTALAGLSSRNNVMKLSEYNEILKSLEIGGNKNLTDYFVSWFRFSKDYELFWRNNPKKDKASVSGFQGEHILDFLYLDIDNSDLEVSKQQAKELIDYVVQQGGILNEIDIYFSSSKGFDIRLPSGWFSPVPHRLNFKIAKRFCELFFPREWVKPKGLIDISNFDINRMSRQAGTRKPVDELRWTGFKFRLSSELLDSSVEEIKQRASVPNGNGLTDEFLSRSAYWTSPKIDKFGALWKQATQEIQDKEYGRRITTVSKDTFVRPVASMTAMPQCIANMLSAFKKGDVPEGLRNATLSILATYFKSQLPDEALFGAIHGLWQSLIDRGIQTGVKEEEIRTIVNQAINNEYKTGCGNSTSSWGSTCLFYCNAKGEESLCPQHKKEGTQQGTVWMDSWSAYERAWSELKEGQSDWTLGLSQWDSFVGGHKLGDIIFFQGDTGSAKTAIQYRISRHMTPIAKKHNMLVVIASPEQDQSTVAELNIQAMAKLNTEQLYYAASNGGISQTVTSWFKEYSDTLIFADIGGFTIQAVEETFNDIEKTTGKKIAVFILDGIVFLDTGTKESGFANEKLIAKQLINFTRQKKFIGISSLHYGKREDKEGYENKYKGNATSAYGTALAGIGASYLASLYYRDGFLLVEMLKARKRTKGQELPPPMGFVLNKNHYVPYSIEEIEASRQNGHSLLADDVLEKYILATHGSKVFGRQNVGSF